MLTSVVLIYSVNVVLFCSYNVMSNGMQPHRRTCGNDLTDRVSRICQPRGGYQRHSRSRRSIVKECCYNVCPDSNIYYYCSNQNVLVESSLQSQNDAVTSAAAAYVQQKQNYDSVEGFVTEQSTILTNLNFFKSRQYGTISPEFRKEAFYVMG